MARNRTDSKAKQIRHLHERAQELSLQIENAQNWHELLLHRLVHGRGGVWAALRYTNLQHSHSTSAIMPVIPHHSCHPKDGGATRETHSWDDDKADQEETPGKGLEMESAADTDTIEPRRKGHATHHQGASSMIIFGDFSDMDASSKRDRVRQGIVLQEDKIRLILSGMKERMVTVDKENETDIESHSI
jgi:hypothetical protein